MAHIRIYTMNYCFFCIQRFQFIYSHVISENYVLNLNCYILHVTLYYTIILLGKELCIYLNYNELYHQMKHLFRSRIISWFSLNCRRFGSPVETFLGKREFRLIKLLYLCMTMKVNCITIQNIGDKLEQQGSID